LYVLIKSPLIHNVVVFNTHTACPFSAVDFVSEPEWKGSLRNLPIFNIILRNHCKRFLKISFSCICVAINFTNRELTFKAQLHYFSSTLATFYLSLFTVDRKPEIRQNVTTRPQSDLIMNRYIDIYIYIRTPMQSLIDSNRILIINGTHDRVLLTVCI